MQEDFLYYIWKFRKFQNLGLRTVDGNALQVLHPGYRNELAGPDFFNARIKLGQQEWAGNIEMHLQSSDWYVHGHEKDAAYDSVILHVVWNHDAEIFRSDSSVIPTLVLSECVNDSVYKAYLQLYERPSNHINCEKEFSQFTDIQMHHWLERLYFERLEWKTHLIKEVLSRTKNNWEATLFILLAKSFGLNHNGEAFASMAESINFKIIQHTSKDLFSLEALLLGQAGLLNGDDKYVNRLKEKYTFLKHKYCLNNEILIKPQFFRLRPDNFPTIRLAQLAGIYHKKNNWFHTIIETYALEEFYALFDVPPSSYWLHHYNFGISHTKRKKKPTKKFIDLLILNCIIPFKYTYYKAGFYQDAELLQQLVSKIGTEKNSISNLFNKLRPGTATNAMESQAVVELKKRYCDLNKCLQCELGVSLLNNFR